MCDKPIKVATRFLILSVVSVLFLLIYSSSTSPLTVCYGADSAFFILVGQGMTEGLLPYRDFFDMKGPYLFLLEYIGQLICKGRTGAFIVQCVNLTLSLCVMDMIYHRNKTALTVKIWLKDCLLYIFPCLCILCFTMEGGNLTEEFSLPLLLVALYFVMDYLEKAELDPDAIHAPIQGFYYGFAFGVLALIRITNAAFLGAILLTVSLDLLFRRKINNLFLNALTFLLGCVIAFAPMCLYYKQQGLLVQMLSQVFLFGVQYSAESSLLSKTISFLSTRHRELIIMTFPIAVLALFRIRHWKHWVLSVASYLLLILACVMGNGYLHYLTLGIPHLVLGLTLLKKVQAEKSIPKYIVVIPVLLLFLVMGKLTFWTTRNCGMEILDPSATMDARQQVLEIRDVIPEEEQNSVYIYNIPSCSNWYLQAGLLPINKYCDWQEHYIILNPQIAEEISQWMQKEKPKWVVVSNIMPIACQDVAEILESNYSISTKNKTYTLYKITE